MPATTVDVRHNQDRSRYELYLEDKLAGVADYRRADDNRLVFHHTEIAVPLRGKGYGEQLVRAALDDVRAAGDTVVPQCWFVAEFIDDNPEYRDVLPHDH